MSANIKKPIEYLLGRVIIVDSLDIAVDLAKRCDGGARLVTLEGELVLPAGAITGGQGKQKASGLLARKRELDEGEQQIAQLESDFAKRAKRGARQPKKLCKKRKVTCKKRVTKPTKRKPPSRGKSAKWNISNAKRAASRATRMPRKTKSKAQKRAVAKANAARSRAKRSDCFR